MATLHGPRAAHTSAMAPTWNDAERWEAARCEEGCPICQRGEPLDVAAELTASWVTVPNAAPLPGYVCVVSRRHAVEPFELSRSELTAFWNDVNAVARALDRHLSPVKLNYEIHGNTIPHLHLHLFPRQRGDRFEGRPIDGRDAVPRTPEELEAIRAALAEAQADPVAPLKDLGWRETAEIDARLERGEIDETGWHAEIARLIVPAYLAAETPWQGSGKGGTAEDWEYARSHVAHAIDRDGSFLDVGCASGYLLQCLPRWTPHALDRYGLDISPELVDLARRRLPELADRLFVGNALEWRPPHRFTYIRTGLEYVPRRRRAELIGRLLAHCDRLIIGVFNEEADARPTEDFVRSLSYRIAGRSERLNRRKPTIDYRVLWIDT
jgi:diadenosine tetraphosphate (Ap4A) HIT family hydrolase/SAM-dependent methyltransferase